MPKEKPSGEGNENLLALLSVLRVVREHQADTLRKTCGLSEDVAKRIQNRFKSDLAAGKRVAAGDFEKFMFELFREARTSPPERNRIRGYIKDNATDQTLDISAMYWVVRLYSDALEEDRLTQERQAQESLGFSEQQVAQYRAAFVEADQDGSGELSEQEILMLFDDVTSLKSSQQARLRTEINKLGNRRDNITFSDFLRILGLVLSSGE